MYQKTLPHTTSSSATHPMMIPPSPQKEPPRLPTVRTRGLDGAGPPRGRIVRRQLCCIDIESKRIRVGVNLQAFVLENTRTPEYSLQVQAL